LHFKKEPEGNRNIARGSSANTTVFKTPLQTPLPNPLSHNPKSKLLTKCTNSLSSQMQLNPFDLYVLVDSEKISLVEKAGVQR
jgi:hypothetical protein